jgi:hypothetical protein
MQPTLWGAGQRKESDSMVSETYLLALLLILGVLGALAWALRAPLKRAGRYFIAWIERDRRAELEAKKDVEQRKEAEREVHTYLHEDEAQEPQQVQLGKNEK